MAEKQSSERDDANPTRDDAAREDPGAYFGPNDAERAGEVPPAPLITNSVPNTPVTEQPPAQQPPRPTVHMQDGRPIPSDRIQSAIRLRRLRVPTLPSRLEPVQATQREPLGGRRRSSSEPHRPSFPPATAQSALPVVVEAPPRSGRGSLPLPAPAVLVQRDAPQEPDHLSTVSRRRRGLTVHGQPLRQAQDRDRDCYDSRIVDFLDVVDPEVATLSSITNIQNSLFVPSLGKWINRRPTYDLSQLPPIPGAFPSSKERLAPIEGIREEGEPPARPRSPSLSSVLSEPQYAILPNDASLEGWPEEDIKALNDYVRHMLHSRRSKIKQRFKAFIKYASRPLGFFVTVYATLITLFGLAWVLFLIGWIYVGDKQLYAIKVIDYVLVALFAVVGDGLAPFRAIDTYHMVFVAHYHRKTWKLRKKLLLPKLRDHNDLPTGDTGTRPGPDLEAQPQQQEKDVFFPVLSDKEQERLVHHQTKLAKSHTFYKPHETETHHAFPLRLLIAVVLLLDLHSCLQITLGVCTWGLPGSNTALTTTVLCCSLASNITAGVLISIGDRRTRKKDVLERLLKQDLTGEVMKKMRKKKEKEKEAAAQREEGEDGGGVAEGITTSLTASLGIPISMHREKSRKSGEEEREGESKRDESPSSSRERSDEKRGEKSGEKGGEKGSLDDGNVRVPGALPQEEDGV